MSYVDKHGMARQVVLQATRQWPPAPPFFVLAQVWDWQLDQAALRRHV